MRIQHPSNGHRPYLPGTLSVQAVHASVQAGFASPAEDHAAKRIDVLEHLVKHPQATFQMKVRGESMRDAGIADGDMLIVDRAIPPRSGHVVVDCEFTVKTYWKCVGRVKLKAANPT